MDLIIQPVMVIELLHEIELKLVAVEQLMLGHIANEQLIMGHKII